MRLLGIEPTPSPHVMKLTVDVQAVGGETREYGKADLLAAGGVMRKLLELDGVRGLYRAGDFIALEREPDVRWEAVLQAAKLVFENGSAVEFVGSDAGGASFGQSQVYVQLFRGIPMQVRVRTAGEERRAALPERFAKAAMEAGAASPNLIKERVLKDFGRRYGEPEEVLAELVAELDAEFGEERLAAMVSHIQERREGASAAGEEPAAGFGADTDPAVLRERLRDADWRVRYAALAALQGRLAADDLPLLAALLRDDSLSVRRLAVVVIGALEGAVGRVPLLEEALRDRAAAVRRTAGDALSDLGDPAAVPAMAVALTDPSRIVRWRAARYLYEVGDARAVDALRAAAGDPEFEVALQARMALERIERGEAAAGTVWQQMARRGSHDE